MGLKEISDNHQDYLKKVGSFSGVPDLRLGDGDKAVIVFLASGLPSDERIDDAFVHSIERKTEQGKTYFESPVCIGDGCQYCLAGLRASHEFGVWVWVHDCFYANRVAGKDLPVIKTAGGREFFLEEIRAVKFWRRGFGAKGYLWDQVVQHFENDGRLDKRLYQITRTGIGLQSSYNIMGMDTKIDEAFYKAIGLTGKDIDELPPAIAVFKNQVAVENDKFKVVTEVVNYEDQKAPAEEKLDSLYSASSVVEQDTNSGGVGLAEKENPEKETPSDVLDEATQDKLKALREKFAS